VSVSAGSQPPEPTVGAGILESILDEAGSIVAVVSLDGRVVTMSASASLHFPAGWPIDTAGGLERLRPVLDQAPTDLVDRPTGTVWRGRIDLGVGDAAPRPHEATIVIHRPGGGSVGFVGVVCRDIADEHRLVDDLVDRLDHDPVTGLLHRQAVIRRAAAEMARPAERSGRVAAMVIDVDRMRDTNQTLGHDVGDQILNATARRLERTVEPGTLIGRLGGDEFVVIMFGIGDDADVVEAADHLRRSLSGRLVDRGTELELSVSIGISITDTTGADPDLAERASTRLVSEADTAVHAAKRSGRARVAVFTDDLHRQAAARTELSAALVRGIRTGELDLEYQPIFSAVSEHCEGAEALVRWDRPGGGRLDASSFVTIAEQTGAIVQVGAWVLDRSCAALRSWIDDGRVDRRFSIHVNVSSLQLASPDFVQRVDDVVERYGLRPRQLVLEVRETMLVDDDSDAAVTSFRALRELGVRVAIDNFGTGTKALSLLTDIGADVLKLDGTLALPSGASDADTRVVRALVMLAHALDMQVVAERVTNLEQLRRLRAAGCDLVQGHLLGRPGPADDLLTRTSV
jgi:diguanylate cyclase (GGDEF)-like protein